MCALGVTLACRQPSRCAYCQMPVPPETRAVVVERGLRREVCDPRCALTHQEQTGARVALVAVTEFETGRARDPRGLAFVTGSDTAPDAHTAAVRNWPAQHAQLHWHRCLPSVLAFSSRAAAERFQRAHGGRVLVFEDLGFAEPPP